MRDPPETPPGANDPRRGTSLTLLQRLRAKEPDAWQTLVRLYTPLLYHWCGRAGLQGADAEDVQQEVFRAVAAHLDGFRRDRPGDSFRGWLRAVTRSMILLHFRKSGRRPHGSGGTDAFAQLQELADPTAAPPDETDAEAQTETDGLLRRALELVRGEFEERTWQMFWRTFVDERSPVDVATELSATPAAVRKAKSRVLHRLKEEFADLIK
jgi:RNA polymerase sigma-70 factor (ECF subfamily)